MRAFYFMTIGLACLATLPAFAQAPPARIGNIWDDRAHQPNPGTIARDESAAGIRPNQAQTNRQNQEVDNLYQQLEGKAAKDRASGQ